MILVTRSTGELGEDGVTGVKVEIAGALVSPLGSAPRLLDRRRGRAMDRLI